MRSVLRLIWFNWDIFSDRPLSLTEGLALEVAIEQIKLFLFQQIHEDFGKPVLTAEDREALSGLTPFQVDAMADELYSRDDLLGRYIRWALLYTRNRYELAEELDQLHGKVGQKSRIVLMTPAIVDFSKWLEDEDELSIEDQVDVMARIACRKDGPRGMASSVSIRCDRRSMIIIAADPEIGTRSPSCAAPLRFIATSSATRPRPPADWSVSSCIRRGISAIPVDIVS